MPFALTAVLFGLIVLATHFIQGITGFGCTVLAMPFCILLTGIDTARPVLTVLALILDVYLLVVSWKHVDGGSTCASLHLSCPDFLLA